ncbi:bifunctional metallophosphatase/5'-nucleotidase [Belnapia moabensis]|uniref:bifunctional metallophosphatase/5'-nucleotidase n=1 Tax=Belnapia moabensis TaxID=365533 RepID=UPI0006946574|nr:bifunctional metallophosphatase/5'-nucleotidase [Belnapia moabensis]
MAADFSLQILHASDFEAGLAAPDRAPQFAAIVDKLEDAAPNSITLSSGDNFIPSPFLNAEGDASLAEPLREAYAALLDVPVEQLSALTQDLGRVDMAVLSAIGVQASVFGNHEFDLGTTVLANAIDFAVGEDGTTALGPLFPYLSANLDFSGDAALSRIYTAELRDAASYAATAADIAAPEVAADAPRVAPWTTIEENGETIGVLGVTTQILASISSVGGVEVLDPNGDGALDNTDELAAILQPYVDQMTAQGIDKVVLLSHLQQYQFELDLATKLSDVDVIVAGGSHALFADDGTPLRSGDAPAEGYPVIQTGADGNPVAVVNTSSEYSYVGRLVVGFDESGVILPVETDTAESRPYATTDETVAELWGNEDPYAEGSRGAIVRGLTDAVEQVIDTKDGEVFGFTDVYLEGRRTAVRAQETNLGDLTGDANLAAAREVDPTTVISIKNGGGIRAEIGTYATGATPEPLPPQANPDAGKPEGGISQLDIENALRFNNGLSLVTVTAEGLKAVLESAVAGVAPGTTPGAFPQVSGIEFSFDPVLPAGERVQSLALVDEAGVPTEVLVRDGDIAVDPAREFRVVTLNFLAEGGDGYAFGEFAKDRVDLYQGDDNSFAAEGREQQALADFLAAEHGTPETAFDVAEVPAEQDERVQNLSVRDDTVLEGAAGGGGEAPVDWNALAAQALANFEATGFWYLDGVGLGAIDPSEPQDWNALAAQVTANYEATGFWYL